MRRQRLMPPLDHGQAVDENAPPAWQYSAKPQPYRAPALTKARSALATINIQQHQPSVRPQQLEHQPQQLEHQPQPWHHPSPALRMQRQSLFPHQHPSPSPFQQNQPHLLSEQYHSPCSPMPFQQHHNLSTSLQTLQQPAYTRASPELVNKVSLRLYSGVQQDPSYFNSGTFWRIPSCHQWLQGPCTHLPLSRALRTIYMSEIDPQVHAMNATIGFHCSHVPHALPAATKCGREVPASCSIYVQVSEAELAQLFSAFGKIVDCRLCSDGNSALRFAFLEFQDEQAAEQVRK